MTNLRAILLVGAFGIVFLWIGFFGVNERAERIIFQKQLAQREARLMDSIERILLLNQNLPPELKNEVLAEQALASNTPRSHAALSPPPACPPPPTCPLPPACPPSYPGGGIELDLSKGPAGDRSIPGTFVDLYYRLWTSTPHSKRSWTRDSLMKALHGSDIFSDDRLQNIISQYIPAPKQGGSPITDWQLLREQFKLNKPKIIAEIGVFRGDNVIRMGKILDELQQSGVSGLEDSFIVCIDSWLLDLEFVYSAEHTLKQQHTDYFSDVRVAGHMMMYFLFLNNIIGQQIQHRVVPLPSASTNAIFALISHQVYLDFVYLDASHANPDVFLDIVSVWAMLNSGGVLVCDDYSLIPAVQTAVDSFYRTQANSIARFEPKGGQVWLWKK